MPVVLIPALLRDLTEGVEVVEVPGTTVRQVIEQLDERFPGMRERLCPEGRLRPGIAVVVDGVARPDGLRCSLQETSEVCFVPALSGGVLFKRFSEQGALDDGTIDRVWYVAPPQYWQHRYLTHNTDDQEDRDGSATRARSARPRPRPRPRP